MSIGDLNKEEFVHIIRTTVGIMIETASQVPEYNFDLDCYHYYHTTIKTHQHSISDVEFMEIVNEERVKRDV